MNSSLHTIRKQTLQFQYNGNADGFALQKEVSEWCNFTLIPEIEQQLDLLDLGDNFITIDKLEIEATANKNDWQQKIRDELIYSLEQKLIDYKPRVLEEASSKALTRDRKLDELILFYFEYGCLPWWGKAMITNNFETVLREWITEEIPSLRSKSISERLKQQISRSQIERILNQVPKELFFQLLKNIYKHEVETINHTESFLKSAQQKAISKAVFRFLLTMVIENEGIINTDVLIRFVYEEVKQKTTSKMLKPSSEKIGRTANPVKIAWQQFLLKEIKKRESSGEKHEGNGNKLQYNNLIDPVSLKKSRDDLVAELQEGIYIDNAGAVIFAAFLPALFKQLELAKNGSIQNPDLAALIIQYCATGNAKIAEYELVLPKILCGLAIEFPVNTNAQITAEQMKEADEMLLSLIEYWSVLKNTSIDGLRESFFKRSGKLGMANNEWILQVEQKPFDMLLQQLPWSISMIKLPWMTNLLKTEWV